jgi:catechol 2,3-dioxygenase-like lactoylglutathione lyase family enzyme
LRVVSTFWVRGANWVPRELEGEMFKETKAFSGFAVGDIAAAKEFYAETLGLEVTEANGMLRLHIAGGIPVLVYPKPGHVPAEYTILNFPVGDIEATAKELTALGVAFERYNDEQDELGIYRSGGPLIAWFKDPAGNVLSIIQD